MPRPKKSDPIKHCQYCQKTLLRKRINGRLEDRAVFLRRENCNRTCMARGMVRANAKASALRKRATKHRGTVCEHCGTMNQLAIHHQDKDITNNSPSNLMTLCSSCHTKHHWQKGDIRGNKRKNYYCKVCGEPARKLDMCQKHYQRYRKYGNPLLTKKKIGSHYESVRETRGVLNGLTSHESPQE